MRFAALGSGSRGNAVLVEQGRTRLLVDCGFSVRETERRLAQLGLSAESLTGILVTHEHTDHVGGVAPLARRYGLPVWMTPGTRQASGAEGLPDLRLFSSHERFVLDDIEVQPFPVPHDAREPSQFVFGDGDVRLGMLTDAGCSTPYIEAQLAGCEALILECNHELDWLVNGSYPPSLKRRVGGRHGHLSNAQAAALLQRLRSGRLRKVVAAHLSEKHNTPEQAGRALAEALGCGAQEIAIAPQHEAMPWINI